MRPEHETSCFPSIWMLSEVYLWRGILFSGAKRHHLLETIWFHGEIKCRMRWRRRLDNGVSWASLILSSELVLDRFSFLPAPLVGHVSVLASRCDSTMSSPTAQLFSDPRRTCNWTFSIKRRTMGRKSFVVHLNSLIWLCMNFRTFHGRSLCPSISATCSRKCSAAWKRSSNGEPAELFSTC